MNSIGGSPTPCKQTDRGLPTNWYQHIPGVKEWRKEWYERKRVQSQVLIHCVWIYVTTKRNIECLICRNRKQVRWGHWGEYGHTVAILSLERMNVHKMQSKKETTERDPKKDPKAMKKRDTHEREEAEREIDGKRPRLDQTIPYRGLVYATRVSDELGSGPDRSFLFFFPSAWFQGERCPKIEF